jgi:hypothetical protein
MNYDDLIFQAIRNYSKTKPQTLVGILIYIDIEDRSTISCEELREGIRRLIMEKKISEVTHGKYFDTKKEDYPSEFSDISREEYQEAYDQANRQAKSLLQKINSPKEKYNCFERHVLSIRWKLENNTYVTEEIKQNINVFAEKLNKCLVVKKIGEVNGFEFGSGFVDILVFGEACDKNDEEIYSVARTILISQSLPFGSKIIREEGS